MRPCGPRPKLRMPAQQLYSTPRNDRGTQMAIEWATAVAAGFGAFAGIAGGVGIEMYKRRRDRIGTANAMAAAICASVREVKIAGVVDALEAMRARSELDPTGAFDGGMFEDAPVKPNMLVFEKHIDKLGLVGSDLSARVILWFSTYAGLQHILWHSLHKTPTNAQASEVLRKAGDAWAMAARDAPVLTADLGRSTRSYPFNL